MCAVIDQPFPRFASCNKTSAVSSISRMTAAMRTPSLRVFTETLTVSGCMSPNLVHPSSKDCVSVFFAPNNPFRTRVFLFVLLGFGVAGAGDVAGAIDRPFARFVF